MKRMRNLTIFCVLAAVAVACTKPASLTVLSNQLSFDNTAGEQELSLKTNQDWSVRSSASWLTVSPGSGGASDSYQRVLVSAQANDTEAARTAELTVSAGELTRTVSVSQAGKPIAPKFTIRDFLNKPVSTTVWYELTGEIISLPEETYGNFFLADETGLVYVYGLTENKCESNDKSFSKLGLKPGDTVTMKTLRSEHNDVAQAGGNTPAYFISRKEGSYRLGRKLTSTDAAWMELPATSVDDKQDLLIHYYQNGKRSYSAYYDYDHLVSSWVAYPLCAGDLGSGKRSVAGGAFPMDPLLTKQQQPYLSGNYLEGNDRGYARGHQLPSADRADTRANFETFFSTNITPQNSSLNGNVWASLESKIRTWTKHSDTDTLYVVTGCSVAGSIETILDRDNKSVTVPVGYYKALLRLAKDKSWSAVAFWFDNKPLTGTDVKNAAMSIDELEKKVGVDFFVNLPAETQKTVESQNPTQVSWWWSN
ncbi:MAG: DNA/RNA non-specific endonuclease [Bacteroidales bacterium]|nr:DNA/RNA non-specific endonuclease [Bacteroidales bacterium]